MAAMGYAKPQDVPGKHNETAPVRCSSWPNGPVRVRYFVALLIVKTEPGGGNEWTPEVRHDALLKEGHP